MKFAHFTQTFPREGETAAQRFDLLWRELELCDETGFDYGFSSVHHFSRLRPSTTAFCAAAAARTSRLRLGTMGYAVPLYDPIRIVEEVAILDNITHGRLEVGLATGVTPEEFRVYGGDWENSHELATEAMFLLRKAFTSSKPFDFQGPFHQYEQVPLSVDPLQQPHPPIWLLSLEPEQLKAASQEGAHTGYIFFRPRQDAARSIRDYLQMWKEHNHQYGPNVCYVAFVYVDETDEAAVANGAQPIIDSMMTIYGRALGLDPSPEREYHDMAPHSERGSGQSRSFGHESIDNQKWLDFDYLHENGLVIVGSPETVARKLRSAAQEGLFNVFCGEFNVGSLTEDSLMRSIKLFGTEVIPALRDFDPVEDSLRHPTPQI